MKTDTIKLLLECNSGIKMGENAIKQLLPHAKNDELRTTLQLGKSSHQALSDETRALLKSYGRTAEDIHPVAQALSGMKICTTMMVKESDQSIASIMTDGCNMGIKSLSKYLNKYKKADDEAKSIVKRLIASEQFIENKMRLFL